MIHKLELKVDEEYIKGMGRHEDQLVIEITDASDDGFTRRTNHRTGISIQSLAAALQPYFQPLSCSCSCPNRPLP